jgi:hypothetical protein
MAYSTKENSLSMVVFLNARRHKGTKVCELLDGTVAVTANEAEKPLHDEQRHERSAGLLSSLQATPPRNMIHNEQPHIF